MLLIRATGNPIHHLPFSEQQQHITKIGAFIRNLQERGKLIGAQPFELSGVILESIGGELSERPYEHVEDAESIVGYYHIEVADMDEALSIARSDPRFADSNWRIELRPVMTVEGVNG